MMLTLIYGGKENGICTESTEMDRKDLSGCWRISVLGTVYPDDHESNRCRTGGCENCMEGHFQEEKAVSDLHQRFYYRVSGFYS